MSRPSVSLICRGPRPRPSVSFCFASRLFTDYPSARPSVSFFRLSERPPRERYSGCRSSSRPPSSPPRDLSLSKTPFSRVYGRASPLVVASSSRRPPAGTSSCRLPLALIGRFVVSPLLQMPRREVSLMATCHFGDSQHVGLLQLEFNLLRVAPIPGHLSPLPILDFHRSRRRFSVRLNCNCQQICEVCLETLPRTR